MKSNKHTAWFFLIVLIGVIVRLIFINKPDGLWNDEYVSWMIASKPLTSGFIEGVKSQCHMPFYYLYLKFFMTLFGQSDILLRLTSVLAGGLSIAVMYFAGLQKDRQTAYACSIFTALSSFLIYYSQEVRFYSLLFLFSALTLLYSIKTVKQPCRKNIILCILFNFLILFTHTIGFVFVFFNLIFISINLFKQYKKAIISIWGTLVICLAAVTPLIVKIFSTQSFSQWWGHFSISRLGFLLTDYFSPVLTNLTNSPDNFFYNWNPRFILFAVVTTLIALGFLIRSLRNKLNLQLFSVAALTVIVLVAASLSGKLVFLTKYSIEIYPILIFLICSGFSALDNKTIKSFFASLYLTLCIFYLIQSPISAPKIRRSEGHKIVTDMLQRTEIQKGDTIILEYYPHDRFEKYFDFSDYKVISINKGNFADYLSADMTYKKAFRNGKEVYKDIFSNETNSYLNNKLSTEVLNDMKYGQKAVLVILNSVAFYSPEKLKEITADKNVYNNEPLLFLVFSYLKNETFNKLAQNLTITRFEQKGSWNVIEFTKLNK